VTLLWFYLGLFVLGISHALEPGHGKLLVSSYLAGNQATYRDAFTLGALVTVVHTLTLSILALVIVSISQTFFHTHFMLVVQVLSGLFVLALALSIFMRQGGLEGLRHSHGHCDHDHDEEAPHKTKKDIIMMGIASGVTPCPTILAAVILGFALGHVYNALLGLFIFSAGLGCVLIILGILLISGSKKITHQFKRFEALPRYLATFSMAMMLALGCYLTLKPFLFQADDHEDAVVNLILPSAS
jgi:nickel/cobalt transporter (NicO) family protein